MPLDFKITTSETNSVPVISVDGEIDIYTSPRLTESIGSAMVNHPKAVVLNLENVHYIDSTGLGAIALSAENLSTQGGRLNVVCTKPQLVKIFEVSGLNQKNVNIYDIEAEAVKNT